MALSHEPPDLSEMDVSDQTREVYAWAGLALYFAQVLEQGAVNLIYAARVVDGSLVREFTSADDFFDSHEAKTLGGLLRIVGKQVTLPEGIEDRTATALDRRNYLAHRYFKERIGSMLTEDGRQEMVDELADMARLFKEVDDSYTELMLRFGERFGLTAELIAREVEQMEAEAEFDSRGGASHA